MRGSAALLPTLGINKPVLERGLGVAIGFNEIPNSIVALLILEGMLSSKV